MPTALWWGRFDADYSRNRIVRGLLKDLGWQIVDFHPRLSSLAYWEAVLRRLPRLDLVWVPCFRQRDLAAASRWARAAGVPLVFDPLISAYDKQVFERGKIPPDGFRANRLLAWERGLFQRADIVLADTEAHRRYFVDTFAVAEENVKVVFVGAEEPLFAPAPALRKGPDEELEALFYGSFIALQGAPVIVAAARRYQGPPLRWTLIGAGPELESCRQAAAGLANVRFEPWLDYAALPERIRRADILLGVFGTTAKAGRVMPNKVFQSLACGRPVVTLKAEAYPAEVRGRDDAGLYWVAAGDADGLAATVARLAERLAAGADPGVRADELYRQALSNRVVAGQLAAVLDAVRRR